MSAGKQVIVSRHVSSKAFRNEIMSESNQKGEYAAYDMRFPGKGSMSLPLFNLLLLYSTLSVFKVQNLAQNRTWPSLLSKMDNDGRMKSLSVCSGNLQTPCHIAGSDTTWL
jgi:hypothetical protein